MLVVDAHLDLAMNAVMWNRDLALSALETRRIEHEEGFTEKGRAAGTVGFPDLREGEIGLVFATVIARKNHGRNSQYRLPHPRDRLRPGAGPARLLPGARAAGDHSAHPHA